MKLTYFARTVGTAVLLLATGACGASTIPNTRVKDTQENREVINFVEKYRKAVEDRDVSTLLVLASRDYFDDMGTPAGEDDMDYAQLRETLARMRNEVDSARYQMSYRDITFVGGDRVFVDVLYTGWFRIETPDGPQWERRLEPHRLVLARQDGNYRILSGM